MNDQDLESRLKKCPPIQRSRGLDARMDLLFEQDRHQLFHRRVIAISAVAAILILGLTVMVVVLLQVMKSQPPQPGPGDDMTPVVEPFEPYTYEHSTTEERYIDTIIHNNRPWHEYEVTTERQRFYVDENKNIQLQENTPQRRTVYVPASID